MIFLKRELPGQPPKRKTGIEKNGEKPDETFRQKDRERYYTLNPELPNLQGDRKDV